MKLIAIKCNEKEVDLGVKIDQGVVNIGSFLANHKGNRYAGIPQTIHEVISNGKKGIKDLNDLVEEIEQNHPDLIVNEDDIELAPCVENPEKIICVGLNYKKHAEETGSSPPEYPILFNKFNNTLAAHKEHIPIPASTEKVDYEAELVIVIGKAASKVSVEHALDHVFGYCAVNDLSARDLQMRTSQWLLGKSCDKFSPIGPYLVTEDEVGNPNQLEICCKVNGEVRQKSNTSDMIFYCDEIISYISQHMTLKPGDIILTGTPEGVVLGYPEEKQQYLQSGDIVSVEIEKLGTLTNEMI
ncbi:fumarylacetoacetate hydrolase family protein [Lederbergia ruris]|uniref:fumarylacetoacetate hydrolase family protein n=1 Tax=Lederbergia ruris TaxID=217495 RepID=UPI0039A2DF2D